MLNCTVEYFQSLLDESRSECLKYAVPRKGDILKILEGNAEIFKRRDDASNKLQQLRKKKASAEEIEVAQKEFKHLKNEASQRQNETLKALAPIVTNDIRLDLEPESLHVHLMKSVILYQQGPKEMAEFCTKNGDQYAKELLDNEDLMKEMLLNGGAKKGRFLDAYKLYDELMELLEEDAQLSSDCYRRLAMATALELVAPINIFDSKTETVDPKQRFLHYVKAHLNGELDPAFPYFTTWEYRHIVDCDATDEELQWGRDQLKRYRPDMLKTDASNMTYCKEVKTDVGYRAPNWGPGQRTYRKLISGGGKCGPRAWMGRFLCKAFGVPTWGVRQPGHAALSRWTPDNGWDTCLGAGMTVSYWENRNGDDFKDEAHSRHFQKDPDVYFRKVTLLQCMVKAYQEPWITRDRQFLGPASFWDSLVRAQLRCWCLDAKTVKGCFERGPEQGQEPEDCAIGRYISRNDKPQDDNEIEIVDGKIRIPACAFSNRTGVDIHKCFEGGGQVHFQKDVPGSIEYKLPPSVPREEYEMSFKICTVHFDHTSNLFCISINGSAECEIPVLYTVGEWVYTKPVVIGLSGGDELKITRKTIENVTFWGLTMREILLKNVSSA